jgi:geranylgeranyl pyrophosphate synthase
MLFLYSYHAAGIASRRRPFYVAVNQCLRGMVTGCDNLLDDEYKQTLNTDLPPGGTRFRSVLDIMVSDRVLVNLLLDESMEGELTSEQVRRANAASLQALTASGAQEATEETGVHVILPPQDVLSKVHHYKTGVLFQCPWAVPHVIEEKIKVNVTKITKALYLIGMGCQILDDLVDLARDISQKRHNYVRSLIVYGDSAEERKLLETLSISESAPAKERQDPLASFPRALGAAVSKAREFLETGTRDLFAEEHRFLAEPTVTFIAQQIGADRYLYRT